jgi:hypothetical protein
LAVAAWIATSGAVFTREAAPDPCPRPAPGSAVPEPRDLRSDGGVLQLDLTVHNRKEKDGSMRYCYLLADGAQSPTLRLNPGDLLILNLKNDLIEPKFRTARVNTTNPHLTTQTRSDPCTSGAMTPTPAVSFVKPSGLVDGHPASSKLDLFEGFAKKIVDAVKADPARWNDTAIFITFDEGGGYYDSGYIQPVDFFGDGTRIPLLVVSRYTKAGHISHEYSDHVSILKFIERNWGLKPITFRSRDNFPNPIVEESNPYVPLNSPALGDLFDLFQF